MAAHDGVPDDGENQNLDEDYQHHLHAEREFAGGVVADHHGGEHNRWYESIP